MYDAWNSYYSSYVADCYADLKDDVFNATWDTPVTTGNVRIFIKQNQLEKNNHFNQLVKEAVRDKSY